MELDIVAPTTRRNGAVAEKLAGGKSGHSDSDTGTQRRIVAHVEKPRRLRHNVWTLQGFQMGPDMDAHRTQDNGVRAVRRNQGNSGLSGRCTSTQNRIVALVENLVVERHLHAKTLQGGRILTDTHVPPIPAIGARMVKHALERNGRSAEHTDTLKQNVARVENRLVELARTTRGGKTHMGMGAQSTPAIGAVVEKYVLACNGRRDIRTAIQRSIAASVENLVAHPSSSQMTHMITPRRKRCFPQSGQGAQKTY